MRRFASLAVAAIAFAAACSSSGPADQSVPAPGSTSIVAEADAGDESAAPDEGRHPSDYIFDQDRLHTFELDLSEDSLAFLDADPTAEEYVVGSLTFEGETIAPVGIRYKGSIGAFVGCLSGEDWTEPSGAKTCTKLSMKVKINEDDPNAEFFGLRRLQFHSQNLDSSQMHERLGYWLFREMGVPAPRSVHARVVVNGTYVGLFALTEQIDGRFTRYNFVDGTGNLYKEVWPVDAGGRPHDDDVYRAGLRTNEDEDPSFERIREFAEAIGDADSEEVARWMDLDEALALAAVDRHIRNDDGPFHWYCFAPAPCASHNFYWYEDPSTETFHLIPWDLDNAFENIEFDVNPVTPIADPWGVMSNDCEPFPYGAFRLEQRSAACDPLTAALGEQHSRYEAAVEDLRAGPLSKARVEEMLDRWEAQIADATAEAAALHDDALRPEEWERSMGELRRSLEHARST